MPVEISPSQETQRAELDIHLRMLLKKLLHNGVIIPGLQVVVPRLESGMGTPRFAGFFAVLSNLPLVPTIHRCQVEFYWTIFDLGPPSVLDVMTIPAYNLESLEDHRSLPWTGLVIRFHSPFLM
jgi:hypothetical protein